MVAEIQVTSEVIRNFYGRGTVSLDLRNTATMRSFQTKYDTFPVAYGGISMIYGGRNLRPGQEIDEILTLITGIGGEIGAVYYNTNNELIDAICWVSEIPDDFLTPPLPLLFECRELRRKILEYLNNRRHLHEWIDSKSFCFLYRLIIGRLVWRSLWWCDSGEQFWWENWIEGRVFDVLL